MSILNHPIPSNGQLVLPTKGSATQDAHQHLSMAQFSSSKNSSLVIARDQSQCDSKKVEMFQNGYLQGIKMPVPDSFLCSLSDNEQFVRIDDDAAGNLDRRTPTSRPAVVLSVSVSSAVKLDARQTELIARKMQKLTGFRSLRLTNVVDPSLIAGFTVCYGDDESNMIDLSVKGQLAALAARVESSEQRIASNV